MEKEQKHDKAIPLQFQLLFNWEIEATQEAILKHKTRMYPTFKVELNNIPIYRLIHHEFERHFITAGQLFKASGLTLTEGFFLFDLKLTEFEVDFLISQFPYCDIWVSVEQARSMASALGIEVDLALLLSDDLDDCYSSDNISRNEIMHNWIVPAIPNLQYSTRALLETTFDTVELLTQPNRKIRTQTSRSKQTGMVMKDRTETGLVRWQVWAYDQFLQQNTVEDGERIIDIPLPMLDRSGAAWDALQGILSDLQTISRGGRAGKDARVLSDSMIVGNMPLKKEYLGENLLLQQLYMAVMAEKIMNELQRVPLFVATAPSPTSHSNTENNVNHITDSVTPIDNQTSNTNTIYKKPSKAVIIDGEEEEEKRPVRLNNDNVISPSSSSLIDGVTTNSRVNNNMLFHDRMDLLEQELYRVKRRTKKKLEETQAYQDELTHQLNELMMWKVRSEQTRKSERVWMFITIVSITVLVLALKKAISSRTSIIGL